MVDFRIRPFLMFEGKAEEAMNFYVSLFPGAKVIDIERYGPNRSGAEGSVLKATFSIGNQTVLCTDSIVKHTFTFIPAFSFLRRLAVWRHGTDATGRIWSSAEDCLGQLISDL